MNTCKQCGKQFRLFLLRNENQPARGITFHHLDPHGYFCTQRCSTKYAVDRLDEHGGGGEAEPCRICGYGPDGAQHSRADAYLDAQGMYHDYVPRTSQPRAEGMVLEWLRDAVPATEGGATCFVPRYQLENLTALLSQPDAESTSDPRPNGEATHFRTEAELAAFLDGLHECDESGAVTARKWDAAQRAKRALASVDASGEGLPEVRQARQDYELALRFSTQNTFGPEAPAWTAAASAHRAIDALIRRLSIAPQGHGGGGEAKPVAWGLPNSAITGNEPQLMMVRLDIPSGDQHGGKLWIPLYTTPPTPSAPVVDDAIKAAAMRCARRAYGFWRGGSNGSWEALEYFDGGYVGRERDAAMYEAEIRAALSGVSAPVVDEARRVVSFLDHANLDTSLLPDDMGDALRSLRAALSGVSSPVGVEGDPMYRAGYAQGVEDSRKAECACCRTTPAAAPKGGVQ